MFTTSGPVGALYPKARSATKAKGRRDDQEIDIFFQRIEKKLSRPKSSISVQVVVLSFFDRLQHHEKCWPHSTKAAAISQTLFTYLPPKQIPTLHKIHFSNDEHKPNPIFSFPLSSQQIHFSTLPPPKKPWVQVRKTHRPQRWRNLPNLPNPPPPKNTAR